MRKLTANLLGSLVTAANDELTAVIAAENGHAVNDGAALLSVRYRPGLTVGQLARVVGLSHAGTVRLIDRLQNRGLMQRQSADDGRAVALRLTARGRGAADHLQGARLRHLDELLAGLDEPERVELHRLLDKLLASMTRNREHARLVCRLCDHDLCVGDACPVGSAARRLEASPDPADTR